MTDVGAVVQPQVALVAAMTASEAAVPPLPPYIAAEAGQGVAYRALPSPKASVLNSVTNTVSDLDSRFTQVAYYGWSAALVKCHGWSIVVASVLWEASAFGRT